jgi:hypothetical protein
MNSLFKETVLIKIKENAGMQQLFYGLLFVACLFFIGGTIYTILTTIRLVATLNPLPGTILIFTAVYVLMQATLAYGFYTARLWIAYALTQYLTWCNSFWHLGLYYVCQTLMVVHNKRLLTYASVHVTYMFLSSAQCYDICVLSGLDKYLSLFTRITLHN